MSGEAAPLLADLVERDIVHVLDVLFVRKLDDGTVRAVQGEDLEGHDVGDLRTFEASSPGMLGSDDVAEAADALDPGSAAMIMVYENRWVAPLASAVRRNGGRLVVRGRLSPAGA